MSDDARKAERQRELEAKKAMLEKYRQKRRLDKSLPEKNETSSSPASASSMADAVLASVLAGGEVTTNKVDGEVAETEKKAEEKPNVVVQAPETTKPNMASAETPQELTVVARGVGVQEAPPKVWETYIRSVQTEQTSMSAPLEGNESSEKVVESEKSAAAESLPEESAEETAKKAAISAKAAALAAKAERERESREAERMREDVGVAVWAQRAGEMAERMLRAEELSGLDVLRDLRGGKTEVSDTRREEGEVGMRVMQTGAGEAGVLQVEGSMHAEELCLAREADAGAGGAVQLWTLDGSLDRPVSTCRADQAVTRACFVPWSAHLVLGASYSGSLLLWDLRGRSTAPVMESATGHSHPVTALQCVGAAHASLLHSASSDGRHASWSLADLSAPVSVGELRSAASGPAGQPLPVAPSCASFAAHETDAFVLGTEQGHLYVASRVKTDAVLGPAHLPAHAGPVRCIASHAPDPVAAGLPVVASAGADWRVRVWQAGNSQRALSLDMPGRCSATGLVWAGQGLGAGLVACDAAGVLHGWNLARDSVRPVAKTVVGTDVLTSLALTKSGKMILVGDLAGHISVYDADPSLSASGGDDLNVMLAAIDTLQVEE